jgi:ketosteroid isomerase-like protein
MSQENVEIVRATIGALNRGDIDAALKDAAPDFEYDFSRSVGTNRGVFGPDQVRMFWEEFAGAWKSVRLEAEDFIEADDLVVTPMIILFRGREGLKVQARVAWVWTFRDGSVAQITFYQERQEALQAAGLSE